MSASYLVAAGGILLAMSAFGRLKAWVGKTGRGVEFFIEGSSSVQGCRLSVFREAENRGARLITADVEHAISSQDGGLMIKIGFQDDSARGLFLGAVRHWCEFNNLNLVKLSLFDNVPLGRSVAVDDYREDDTNSPPGSRKRSRSRSSEGSVKTYATEIVDDKDEQVVFQSVEEPTFGNAMDSCHLLAHSECKGTPVDSDPSNRVACSTGFHRAFDGTSDRFPPWVRISVVNVDPTPVECTGKSGRVHHRFRVELAIDFKTEEFRENHRFCWKEGTHDDGKNPVLTFVHVKDYVMFQNGVEWKHKNTTEIWDSN